MAAERACELSEKPARVVACTSQQAGLLALVELDPEASVGRATPSGSTAALAGIRAGRSRPPPATTPRAASCKGDAVGFAGDEIVAWGGAGSTLSETIEHLAEGAEIVTVIGGEGAPIAARGDRRPRPRRGRDRDPRGRPAELVVAARGPMT